MPSFRPARVLLALLAAGCLTHCGVPSPPQCKRPPVGSRHSTATLMATARENWQTLASPNRRHEWPAAREQYNTAVSKLFDQLRCGPNGWNERAAALGTAFSTRKSDVDPSSLDALVPASTVNGRRLESRQTTEGLGVAAVGWKSTSPVGQKREKFQLPNGLPYNLTAVLDFSSTPPLWCLAKRWQSDDYPVGPSSHTLAADWSAPNAFYWRMCQLDNLLLQNVVLPDRFTEETGIYFVTPYDPDKIPIVFVHGLVSSPDAFKNMINALSPEPWFRKNYQIWLYNYPTGNPWIYSSMNFREKMREACTYARSRGHDRNLNRMVVVAHSMGGLLTRSSITDPGQTLYASLFQKPFDQLKVSKDTRRMIEEGLLYQPLPEPERVVFLAVPHRGSPMANLGPAVWFSKLIRLPKTLTVELLDSTLLAMSDVVQGEDPARRLPTSINSLSPNSPTTVALNQLSLPEGVTCHSIIGDRGKGDTPDSSDGVVPYWSSHITPVASELIVPSNHSVPDSPQAASELKRILKLHLEGRP